MIELVLVVIIGIRIGIVFAYFYFRARAELVARRLGDEIGRGVFERQKAELDAAFEAKYRGELAQWKVGVEKELRADALARSRVVLKGRLAEQLAPLFEVFGYNPSDARFIGDPVDYVIFDGYTEVRERREDRPITVVLADVKTGRAALTYEQRRIKRGVERGHVEFKTIRMSVWRPDDRRSANQISTQRNFDACLSRHRNFRKSTYCISGRRTHVAGHERPAGFLRFR